MVELPPSSQINTSSAEGQEPTIIKKTSKVKASTAAVVSSVAFSPPIDKPEPPTLDSASQHNVLIQVLLEHGDTDGRTDASKAAIALRQCDRKYLPLRGQSSSIKKVVLKAQADGAPVCWIQNVEPLPPAIQPTLSAAARDCLLNPAAAKSEQASPVSNAELIPKQAAMSALQPSTANRSAVSSAVSIHAGMPKPPVLKSASPVRIYGLMKILLRRCDESGISDAKQVVKTLREAVRGSSTRTRVEVLKEIVQKAQDEGAPVVWIERDQPAVQLTLDAAARKCLRAQIPGAITAQAVTAAASSKPKPVSQAPFALRELSNGSGKMKEVEQVRSDPLLSESAY